ncbi:hypothetical protein SAMN00777080_3552 [Aquiflexum balticum DSM 16537]|uniref:Helix-turn-helix domain-containing protein n=1 Tax=Aquiflexum balticum DSM 16537 TaxID=758820 RepID=A0A1W2H7M6_9BACT|nr:hypothetical protein [Aquiflexum balticum]SMD44915.1 hypothetical protein SAMN00777080_3552 [Aquiflexum balticum DSM 16537]
MDSGEIWKVLKRIQQDKRALTSHISVFVAILQLFIEGNRPKHLQVSRQKLMKLAHIKGIATYHNCINNLVEWGYIKYEPSYHPLGETRVWIVKEFDNIEFRFLPK